MLSILVLTAVNASAQQHSPTKTQAPAIDSAFIARLMSVVTYPVIKGYPFAGVIPVENIEEIPDPSIQYKILFELIINNPDSTAAKPNKGLVEIARIVNLHYASGIPLHNLDFVVVAHGPALNAFMHNEAYKQKFNTDNPNIPLIRELQKQVGLQMISCGQAMFVFGFPKISLLPEVKVSLTAQTVLSGYQMKGYMVKVLDKLE